LRRADLVGIGRILRSQGNQGQVKLKFHHRTRPELSCRTVYLAKGGEVEEYAVESLEIDRNSVFLKLEGVETLAQADALAGRDVFVREDCFRPLERGRYYDFQLIGCRVVTREGAEIGRVTGIAPAGEATLLVVAGPGGERDIPFIEEICVRVDPANKLIVIDPPEGLLDLNEI